MHHAAVWQHSSNSNNKIVHNSIEHFLWDPYDFFSDDALSCLWIVFANSVFQVPPQKIVKQVEILGIGWPRVIGLMWNESVPWELMPEVFKCSVQGGGLKSGGASFLEQPPFLACLPISLAFWYPGLIQGSDCFWAQENQRQKIKDKKLYLINHWRDKTCSHK